MMMSPRSRPASTAGLSGSTDMTTTPRNCGLPSSRAMPGEISETVMPSGDLCPGGSFGVATRSGSSGAACSVTSILDCVPLR